MFQRYKVPLILFALAVVFGLLMAYVASDTVVPMAARGTGPGGVSVTTGGWVSLFLTGLGAGGFTISGIVAALFKLWQQYGQNPEQAGRAAAQAFKRVKVVLWDSGDLGNYESLYASAPDDQKPFVAAAAWAHGESLLTSKFGPRPTGANQ